MNKDSLSMLLVLLLVVVPLILIAIYGIGAAKKRKEKAEEERRIFEAEMERKRIERERYLSSKYTDATICKKIIERTIWQGETKEMIIDSIGQPSDIDQKVLKTKKREIWKYFPKGTNRFGLRVTIENDIVVGWDEKL